MDQSEKQGESVRRGRAVLLDTLTDAQRGCLQLVAQHMTSKEIARLLGISKDTVDQRISASVRKLGATSRAEAARFLIETHPYDRVVYDPIDMVPAAEPDISISSLGGRESPNDHRLYEVHSAARILAVSRSPWIDALPLKTQKDRINTLSWQARLLWMVVIPVVVGLLGLQLIAVLDGLQRFYQ